MSHSLVEIPSSQWSKVRDLYVKAKNRASCYNLLQNYIDWEKKCHRDDFKIYSLDGDWEKDGTFVAVDNHDVYINTLDENPQRLLTTLTCLDPERFYVFAGIQDRLLPVVQQHFADTGVDFSPYITVWYHISRDKAFEFPTNAPRGITVATLEERHAEQVDYHWPHRSPGSIEFVKRLIRLNDSVGAFDEKGQLVAWCLKSPLGALGLLQVMDSHKRQGLGQLMVSCLSKITASKGFEVLAPVIIDNVPSRSLFEKMGFNVVDKVYWIIRTPKSDK